MRGRSPAGDSGHKAAAIVCAAMVLVSGCSQKTEPGNRQGSMESGFSVGASEALQEAVQTFGYHGRPIHPGLVYELLPWLSDSGGGTVVAVDVMAGEASNRLYGLVPKAEGSFIECEVPSTGIQSGEEEERFGYERLGTLRDGTQVLRTSYWGGGSGVFLNLVLVRFQLDEAVGEGGEPYERLVMKCVGICPLGDRDDGEVAVHPDRIVIGPSRYREKAITLKAE